MATVDTDPEIRSSVARFVAEWAPHGAAAWVDESGANVWRAQIGDGSWIFVRLTSQQLTVRDTEDELRLIVSATASNLLGLLGSELEAAL